MSLAEIVGEKLQNAGYGTYELSDDDNPTPIRTMHFGIITNEMDDQITLRWMEADSVVIVDNGGDVFDDVVLPWVQGNADATAVAQFFATLIEGLLRYSNLDTDERASINPALLSH